MHDQSLRFLVFGNEYHSSQAEVFRRVSAVLQQHGAEVVLDELFANILRGQEGIDLSRMTVAENNRMDADFAISIGGDGTLLKTAESIGSRQIPVIGINTGRLGFLADVLPEEIEPVLSGILQGNFTEEAHAVMQVGLDGEPLQSSPYALNDIALLKKDDASMITIHAKIDGEHLNTYQADGLIVATPTGSTAYSLSNGGPIIALQTGVFCLTPVAPHSLNVRPVVIRDTSEIELTVESRTHQYLIAVDGRSEKHSEQVKVKIRKAPYTVNIVRRQGRNYYGILREKMMWGMDKR